jgi:hypothetical protein
MYDPGPKYVIVSIVYDRNSNINVTLVVGGHGKSNLGLSFHKRRECLREGSKGGYYSWVLIPTRFPKIITLSEPSNFLLSV